jgi:hypothetical protein
MTSDPGLEKCKQIVDRLNQKNIEMKGTIEKLDIIEFEGVTVKTIEQIHL